MHLLSRFPRKMRVLLQMRPSMDEWLGDDFPPHAGQYRTVKFLLTALISSADHRRWCLGLLL